MARRNAEMRTRSPRSSRISSTDARYARASSRVRRSAAWQADALGDLRDRTHIEELVVVAGHEYHALVIAHVDGQRDPHVGEHDRVVEWNQLQQRLWAGRGRSGVG